MYDREQLTSMSYCSKSLLVAKCAFSSGLCHAYVCPTTCNHCAIEFSDLLHHHVKNRSTFTSYLVLCGIGRVRRLRS